MILSVANQKGGTGKTTLVFNLSVMRSRRIKTLAIDMDPQESLTDVFAIRDRSPTPYTDQLNAFENSLKNVLERAKQNFDDIILDFPGLDNEILIQSLLYTDVFLVPFKVSRLDFMALENMDNLAAAVTIRNPIFKALAVMTQAPTHAMEQETKQIRSRFEKYKTLKLLPCMIHDRAVYRHSVDQGKVIIECRDKKAIQEITKLYKTIY